MLWFALTAVVLLQSGVLGDKDCNQSLLTNNAVTSSSQLSANFSASHAQMSSKSAWCPTQNFSSSEYLQIVFSSFKRITRIKIDGETNPGVNQTARRVTKYLLQVSRDGVQFQNFKQISQSDVVVQLNAFAVRLVPRSFNAFPCMRVEIYGCKAPEPETCKEKNGTCSQICKDNERYCFMGVCFFRCVTDWMCTKYITCKCHPGYKLLNDKRTCKDINECKRYNGGCDDFCENTVGSYICSCKSGYKLERDRHGCSDINECDINDGGCNQICENNQGSYKCKCWTGYKMSADNHTCIDIDECKVDNGGCSHTCINLAGGRRCACPVGFQVDALGKNCVDTNECYLANGGCETFCHNNNGSYTCSCRSGFELYDKLKCRDIDECARKTDDCDDQSTTCFNYQGSYECRCKKGFKYIPNNKRQCERMTCPPLVESQGTSVSPSECLVKNGRKVGDKCTFSCKAGYVLLDPSKNTMTCLDTTSWDMPIISCRPIRCPSLTPPANGYVYPPFCSTTGNTFGQSCYYRCNKGYSLKNGQNPKRDCTNSGAWDISTPATCAKVFIKPWINCPPDVVMSLDPKGNQADVTALLLKPKSNVGDVKMFPEKYRTSLVFPAGTTTLTYKATNKNGDVAQCTTDVIIEDKTPPRVVYCPNNIYESSPGIDKVIIWRDPEFADNVKVTSVTSDKKPNQKFGLGETLVLYVAKDAAGNTAQCSFSVTVKRLQCPVAEDPDNGKLTNCMNYGSTKYCRITCNTGKQTFMFTYGATCQLPEATWNEIPACVDATRINAGDSCPSGQIQQKSLTGYPNFIKYCVSCPRGYKYDSSAKDCIKCPVGYTSLAESSAQCTKCPAGKSTVKAGSKNCIDQCKPGTSSEDGFDLPLNPNGCSQCSMGYYSDIYGASQCKQCPDKLMTKFKGSNSKDDCGIAPTVTEFGPMNINVDENDRVEFVCKAVGPPTPSIKIVKARPTPDGFGGPVKIESIVEGGKQIGIRYIIQKASEHDQGLYSCVATNVFGKNTKFLNLQVNINLGSGQSGV
ncbi:sushi, von Willebrand factor type A, EGF and pentraxin domain-containing protein 1-like [Actinia tenebrosa]|uniref:Sushi, von Willebrand factor type A, EGF and pentraxin domain-containing protein 1-like n=1 Tax=Actinia tenebrosa TaxID=6105 RepID=A0A6P8HQJ2_ACTTE|nr:sushi, von Willebrand factor type A, EGF and pentraxin domain-containing protein 1-like [Actinia tenebrosa]